jgi:hypothetical protein
MLRDATPTPPPVSTLNGVGLSSRCFFGADFQDIEENSCTTRCSRSYSESLITCFDTRLKSLPEAELRSQTRSMMAAVAEPAKVCEHVLFSVVHPFCSASGCGGNRAIVTICERDDRDYPPITGQRQGERLLHLAVTYAITSTIAIMLYTIVYSVHVSKRVWLPLGADSAYK